MEIVEFNRFKRVTVKKSRTAVENLLILSVEYLFQTGWFPKSYVRLIGGPTPTSTAGIAASFKSDSPVPTIVTSETPTGSLDNGGSARASPAVDKPSACM